MEEKRGNAGTVREPVGRMLVTGGSGLLGTEIEERFRGRYEIRAPSPAECDVTREDACRRAVAAFRPHVVVHCAAYTAVDRAEREEAEAFAVNEEGTRNVARACREEGALIVAYGTDYIFDGRSGKPYVEEDPPAPLSAYGRSKLAGEAALREEAPDHLLIRSQWLYGPHGRNFVFAVLERARRGEPLRVVDDQVGCPTYARDLAEATERLLDTGARGTIHFSNEGETSWHGFAAFVLARTFPGKVSLSPARTADLAYPAPRPAYSVLDKEKYRRITGSAPRPWGEAAAEFLGRIGEGDPAR